MNYILKAKKATSIRQHYQRSNLLTLCFDMSSAAVQTYFRLPAKTISSRKRAQQNINQGKIGYK